MSTPFAYTLNLYDDAHDCKHSEPYRVPLKIANNENLQHIGSLATDYNKEEITIVPWPSTGKRKVVPGTGIGGGTVEGEFRYNWKGDTLFARNLSCPQDGECGVGRLQKGADPSNKTHIITREVNYHPNGSQLFFPKSKRPFVALLAPPGDDVRIEDFTAFYFDGTCGLHIKPGVWHNALFPVDNEMIFYDKQGSVHACVMMDTLEEFGKLFLVPLKPEFAVDD